MIMSHVQRDIFPFNPHVPKVTFKRTTEYEPDLFKFPCTELMMQTLWVV